MVDITTVTEREFFAQIDSYLNLKDRQLVREAYDLARQAHGNQRRKSGELFFTHPLTVAFYISEYHLEASALIAALLHDVAEDTLVTLAEIEAQFGSEVALLVDGVTKLKDVTKGIIHGKALTKQEVEDITLHKLLGVMIEDVRAVLIKLFDRLHNMRTIKATAHHRQVYKARETLAIYAPLANRLGIWELKNWLEGLSLEVLYPEAYYTIETNLRQITQHQQEEYQVISGQIFEMLVNAQVDVRNVILAPENVYTVFQDINEQEGSFDEVDETMRLVILVDETPSCYQALGFLHQMWQPIPGTFDDYIAVPRDNLYRALHTTVIHTNGRQLKLRIRSIAMNKVDEIGILARWLFKGTPLWSRGVASRVETFLDTIYDNINLDKPSSSERVQSVKEDILVKQIRVYSPRGAVRELAKGATAIDFAYAIHTGLGDQCYAAYVNDLLYPLNKPLNDGDRVRILKKPRSQPQRAWLDQDLGYIRTSYARHHAQRWFRKLSKDKAIVQGRHLLQAELEMIGFPAYSHAKLAELFHYATRSDLYYDLGRAELLPTRVALRVLQESWSDGPAHDLDNTVITSNGNRYVVTNVDGRTLKLCGSCHPRPPDAILGYLRHHGGVTVHKKRCHTLRPERMAGRLLKLGWGESLRRARLINMIINVYDRPGLLYEITNLLQDEHMNIAAISTPPAEKRGEVHMDITIEVVQPRQLVRILHQINELSNVFLVRSKPVDVHKQSHATSNTPYQPE